jgi:hypothetical protein
MKMCPFLVTKAAAHAFVSVVGAAWLLMGQPGVTDTRSIADALQRA